MIYLKILCTTGHHLVIFPQVNKKNKEFNNNLELKEEKLSNLMTVEFADNNADTPDHFQVEDKRVIVHSLYWNTMIGKYGILSLGLF